MSQVGDRLGPYVLEARLGEGGVGAVFRATHEPDGAVVALKVLRKELASDPIFLRRFAHEARAAQQVHHPNLVPVLDAGQVGGQPYLALGYVDGGSLKHRLAQATLSVPELVRLVKEIASGLDALHHSGIVHRDVKPANILLDANGAAVLTDFGLARGRAYSVLTQRGQVVGTIDYLAPERLRGRSAEPSSDIYSLGCVAFECLAGRPPFGADTLEGVGRAHLYAEPSDPCQARTDAPTGLGWAVLQALEKEPSRRPRSAGRFAQLLVLATRGGMGDDPRARVGGIGPAG